ncbi:MAG: hypothetical protein KDD82_25965 [Planctomycetes bacterium]|nr:hypothetical protein [Planctomycetota bacterium]
MFGGETPDLATTPCPACGQLIAEPDVVWDPWHTSDLRTAALPYHRACAAELLPPAEPAPHMRVCGICGGEFSEAELAAAFEALHTRFTGAKGVAAAAGVVWRLAERSPRRFVTEHLSCVLGGAKAKGS